MAPAGADELVETWFQKGLANTELALGATITRETWARLDASAGREAAEPLSAAPGSHLTVGTLPFIDVAEHPSSASTASPAPTLSGDILVTGLLGEGGMGRVLSARQRSLSRDVAIKTVRPELANTANAEGIVREGLITGHLEHPNITPVHQLGRDADGRPIMVMKRIVGVPWSELLADANHPTWRKLAPDGDRLEANLEILMQLCNGLSFAHAKRVIHRDIKTDNVMIGEFGEVYLCDWGIAIKVTDPDDRTGLVGTPCQLAPEMLDPDVRPDERTDVYLLGATLHNVLTGTPRHVGKDLRAVLTSALESAPVDYDEAVPVDLARLCNRTTHKDPSQRPASAAVFRTALADHLSHRSSVALERAASAQLASASLDEAAIEARQPSDLEDIAAVLTEARVGFEQALRLWPENEEASRRLSSVLGLAIGMELRRENIPAARTLANALGSEQMQARVRDLEWVLAQRARDAGAFQRVKHDGDFAVASPLRSKILVTMALVGCAFGLTTAIVGQQPSSGPAPFFSIVPPTFIFIAGATGAWVLRKKLFVNQANKRLVGILLGEILASIIQRTTGMILGEDHGTIMRTDVFLLAGAIAGAGVFVSARWVGFGVVLVAAGCAMKVFPSHGSAIFIFSHLSALFVLAVGWKDGGATAQSSSQT